MPVTTLFVEGDLDAQLLAPFLAGSPAIEKGGSKNALAPRIRQERERKFQGAMPDPRYLRDRDFDFLPELSTDHPIEDKSDGGLALGWRWARHEIESYMLEPHFVAQRLGVDKEFYESALVDAARRIKCYQAARWSIGQARIQLPPAYEFSTSPDDRNGREFYLPDALDRGCLREWTRGHARSFLERISPELDDGKIAREFDNFLSRFSDDFLKRPENVLVWFSGKDFMKALEPWLSANKFILAGVFRIQLRDWMARHVEEVAEHLPEWRAFRDLLR